MIFCIYESLGHTFFLFFLFSTYSCKYISLNCIHCHVAKHMSLIGVVVLFLFSHLVAQLVGLCRWKWSDKKAEVIVKMDFEARANVCAFVHYTQSQYLLNARKNILLSEQLITTVFVIALLYAIVSVDTRYTHSDLFTATIPTTFC